MKNKEISVETAAKALVSWGESVHQTPIGVDRTREADEALASEILSIFGGVYPYYLKTDFKNKTKEVIKEHYGLKDDPSAPRALLRLSDGSEVWFGLAGCESFNEFEKRVRCYEAATILLNKAFSKERSIVLLEKSHFDNTIERYYEIKKHEPKVWKDLAKHQNPCVANIYKFIEAGYEVVFDDDDEENGRVTPQKPPENPIRFWKYVVGGFSIVLYESSEKYCNWKSEIDTSEFDSRYFTHNFFTPEGAINYWKHVRMYSLSEANDVLKNEEIRNEL